jgi:hypothetical protein
MRTRRYSKVSDRGVNEINFAVSTRDLRNSGKLQVRIRVAPQRTDLKFGEYRSVPPVVWEHADSFIYLPDEFGCPSIDLVNLDPTLVAFGLDAD